MGDFEKKNKIACKQAPLEKHILQLQFKSYKQKRCQFDQIFKLYFCKYYANHLAFELGGTLRNIRFIQIIITCCDDRLVVTGFYETVQWPAIAEKQVKCEVFYS